MKITRNTDRQLIVENNPVWVAALIWLMALAFIGMGMASLGDEPLTGGAFIAAGAAMGVVFSLAFIRRTQVIFDRGSDTIEMRRKTLLGYTRRQWKLSDAERAIVETSHSDDSDTHRAVLVIGGGMDAGRHPLTVAYYSGRGAARAASAINDWLAGALDTTAPGD